MIELNGITKRYGKREILQGIDLKIAEGEHVVLTGPSGCGKSTLLRIISGLEVATGGEAKLRGETVTNGRHILVSPPKRKIALIAQDLGLWPASNVRANILLGRREAGKLLPLAEELGIADLLRRKVSRLSAGERQRVALARFLLDAPNILLLDEPFSALDVIRKQEIYQLFRKLRGVLQSTMLTVSHDPGDAVGLGADRVVVIENGIVAEEWLVGADRGVEFKSDTLRAWGRNVEVCGADLSSGDGAGAGKKNLKFQTSNLK